MISAASVASSTVFSQVGAARGADLNPREGAAVVEGQPVGGSPARAHLFQLAARISVQVVRQGRHFGVRVVEGALICQ